VVERDKQIINQQTMQDPQVIKITITFIVVYMILWIYREYRER